MRKLAHISTFLAAFAPLLGCGESPPGDAKGKGKGKETGPPLVTAAIPLVKTITQFTDVTGTLAAVKRVEIRPQVGGTIQKVLFKDGAEVQAGQVLVIIDPVIYTAEVKKAEGDLANTKAESKLAAAEAARFNKLRSSGSVSIEEVDKANAELAVAEAKITSSLAQLDLAKQNLAYTKIIAPFAGRVGRILINEGNVVSAAASVSTGAPGSATTGVAAAGSGSVLTVLTTVDPIYAYFDLDEQTVLYYLDLINAGKFESVRDRRIPIEIQLKGQQGYPYKGELDFASNEISPTTGSLTIRAVVPNPPPHKFTPGLFVRARLPGAKVPDAVLIPESAVSTDQERKVVYVVTPENRVSTRPVKLGPRSEGLRVVLDGVKAGERVIIRGMQRVQDGIPVEVEPGEIQAVPDPTLAPATDSLPTIAP